MSTELFKQLKSLSPADWKALRSKVDAFQALRGSTEVIATRASETSVQTHSDYLSGITWELRERRLIRADKCHNPHMFKDAWIRNVDEAWKDVLAAVGKKLPIVEQQALARVAAKALADWLENTVKCGVSIATMCTNAHNTMRALNSAFPGYAQSGMLALTIRHQNG